MDGSKILRLFLELILVLTHGGVAQSVTLFFYTCIYKPLRPRVVFLTVYILSSHQSTHTNHVPPAVVIN